jgi:hypothetical protein
MDYRLPPARFIVPLPIAWFADWAKDKMKSLLEGFVLPDWFPYALIGLFIGLLINDLYNSRSWLRHNWRHFRRVFDVQSVHAGHLHEPHEHIPIICNLKFRKQLKNALLTVCIVSPSPTREPDRKITHQEILNVAKYADKRLMLGNMAITRAGDKFARHCVWGDKLGEQDLRGYPIIPGGRSAIEISIKHQIYRVYVHFLDTTREENSRIYLLTQDDFPSLI